MAYTTVSKVSLTLTDGRTIEVDGDEWPCVFQGSVVNDSLRHNPRRDPYFEGLLKFQAPAEKAVEWGT